MASVASSGQVHSSVEGPHTTNESSTNALIASTLQLLEQRAPPAMHEILAAFAAKGDGDREMLLALLNAKAAEDNRLAADKNLRRTLLEVQRESAQCTSATAARYSHGQSYAFPSPPLSTYQQSPLIMTNSPSPRRRMSASSSASRSSDDDLTSAPARKRRRSRSSHLRTHHAHSSQDGVYAMHTDAPSPSSSQSSAGSSRSREAMTIGSLLSPRRDGRMHDRRHLTTDTSAPPRDDGGMRYNT